MRGLRQFLIRLANVFTSRRGEDRLNSEIEEHIVLQTEENIRAGMPPGEARRQALLKFGAAEAIKEAYRAQATLPLVETTMADVKYGLRVLRKSPGFTAVALLVLGLGIGANTAIFSIIDSVLLRPLPVRDASRLVVVPLASSRSGEYLQMSYADYADYKAQDNAFSDMLAYSSDSGAITLPAQSATRVQSNYVTGNFFSTLGLRPFLGRLIQPTDERNSEVAVLGYSFWRQHLSGDPAIIRKTIQLNGRPVTVVGIAPKQFHGVMSFFETDVYVPLGVMQSHVQDLWTGRNERALSVLAYLKPGVTLAEARASVRVVATRLAAQYPELDKDISADVLPETLARPQPDTASDWPLIVSVFLVLAFVVLAVASVNLVNLLLARANIRAAEIAVRSSLGASRSRLVRQLLTETLLLASGGCVAGILVSAWCTSLLVRVLRPVDIPLRLDFSFDWRIFAYACAASALAGILAGIIPALRASRVDLSVRLHESGRKVIGGRSQTIRNGLIIAQISGCFVLLIVAGLFIRVLERAEHMDLGFDPHNVAIAQMDVSDLGLTKTRSTEIYDELIREIRALPGVESAAYSHTRPFGNFNMATLIAAEGKAPTKDQRFEIFYDYVDRQFFTTVRIPLLQGSNFNDSDDANSPRVAIINQEMARKLWPGENPIGKRFQFSSDRELVQVIGISRNAVANDPTAAPHPYFYLPFSQHYASLHVLNVRSSLPPQAVSAAVERQIHKLMPGLPLMVMTMDDSLQSANGFFLFHIASDIAGPMGLLGLVLAVVGVYGMVSYSATRRAHEIGIRMALGALRRDVLLMVLRQVIALVATGLAIGALLALTAGRFMKDLLVGISPHDPLIFLAATTILVATALLASYFPARHAADIDPMVALRHE